MREFNPAVTVPAPRRIRAPVPSQEAKDAAGIRAFFFLLELHTWTACQLPMAVW